ncbi:MAG: type II toxin-antitoxin system RelE/ParE family toxin [Parvibaculales bacterium]
MAVKLELTKAAEADLVKIYLFGLERYGLQQADAYAANLRQRLANICAFPLSYPEDPDLKPILRVSVLLGHIILYRYEETHITVLRIRHHSEDWR